QQKAIFDANARGAQPEEIKRLEGWKFLQHLRFLPVLVYDKHTVDAENLYDSVHSEESDENGAAGGERKPSTTLCSEPDNSAAKKPPIEEFNVAAMEDDDAEVEDTTPITVEPMVEDIHSTPSFHYGMAVAQDVFELDDSLKIDAKMEIMKVIVKYQKQQLHRTVMHLAGS
ncbi:hypothetical protein KR222_009995, partial [Zaprionus bogoriensis]